MKWSHHTLKRTSRNFGNMPHVNCSCIAVGEPDRESMVGLIFRVEGFPFDILVKGLSGGVGTIHWLFFQN
jgi:hypothetical protein